MADSAVVGDGERASSLTVEKKKHEIEHESINPDIAIASTVMHSMPLFRDYLLCMYVCMYVSNGVWCKRVGFENR